MDKNESDKIFKYLSNEFLYEIFNVLIHDKEITNTFMRKSMSEYYDAIEEVIQKNNDMFEQTEKRKDFMENNKKFIDKQRKKNESTDYYYDFLHAKHERK